MKKKFNYFGLIAGLLLLLVFCLSAVFVHTDAGVTVDCAECEGTGTLEGAVCEVCGGDGQVAPENRYYATYLALLPPIIAIVLALITKETYSSLFIGIVAGALLNARFHPVDAVTTMVSDGFIAAISGNAGIFMFLVILGVFVALMNQTGGSAAFGRWASAHIKTRTGALIATFILGILIFIDDYFNCLTVGTVMRPLTDRQRISRAKLAYLIDATAAPICMIAPISSWAAAVSSVARDLDTGVSGIGLFVQAIPFNFYSLLTLVFVIAMSIIGVDYGPMAKAELEAYRNGNLGALGNPTDDTPKHASVLDMLLPVIILIVCCVLALVYVGGFFGTDIWGGTDCAGNFIDAFANTDSTVGLPLGAIVALLLTMLYLLLRRLTNFKETMATLPKGFIAMVPAFLILTMAVSLKNMTNALGGNIFVRNMMASSAEALSCFLPCVIFLVAVLLSFATGTSWGTFSILIPIVTSIFEPTSPLMIIGVSACLAGAVCGDHCSPISDTTIMASAGADCEHVSHVSTQLPYALTVAGLSFVCYVLTGILELLGMGTMACLIVLPFGAVLTVAFLLIIRSRQRGNRKA